MPGSSTVSTFLAQFHCGFTAIVMAENPERVTVAEAAELQKIMAAVDVVEFRCNVTAARTRPDQFQAFAVDMAVDFPEPQVFVGGVFAKERALQRRVVTEDHREAVETEDITRFNRLVGDRIVGAIRVDAGLEPGPGVHEFDERETTCQSPESSRWSTQSRPRAR